ncbi:Lrp/AsnC family transcriptional regulator [Rhodobacteraceae bacterium CCMM004]|nr:Lrp/AsnC family transcriptional regulator [Rhodobacteraceae bacterium CCMM004]
MERSDPERALLREVQRDVTTPLAELGRRVGMAQSTVWRKLQEFEAAGLLTARVALLDPVRAGVPLCIFADVTLADHAETTIAGFTALVRAHAEVIECHAVAGASDYVLKIRAADMAAYERFLSGVLLRSQHIRSVQSAFSLKEIKHTTALPV